MNTKSKQNQNWYVASTGNHQGLIIEEKTSDGLAVAIAIAYDRSNARLIANAPALLGALESALTALRTAYAAAYCGPQNWTSETKEQLRLEACAADNQARAAIAKAKGK